MSFRALAWIVLAVPLSAWAQALLVDDSPLQPVRTTGAVANDADDPAIWINQADPSRSLILGTNKVAAPDGGLYVFDLDGRTKQIVTPLDRPNNVDVEYGLPSPGGSVDIAVVTERLQHRLRVFCVTSSGVAELDGGRGIPVMDGEAGEARMPMGIALYRRPRDGAVFAIVAPKTGGRTDYLWQYRLAADSASGLVSGTRVRRFGNFSGTGEIEAVAVDDELGYVYYADEEYAIHKWHADPDHPDAARELAVFARDGFTAQREGLAIVSGPNGKGFIIGSDQIAGTSALRIYRREGEPGDPHDHARPVAVVRTSADSTDGIDIAPSELPPAGRLLIMMNSGARNFQMYRWEDIERRFLVP